MISVFGTEGASEHKAALYIRDLIQDALLAVADSPQDSITILSNAKCHGQTTSDIDLLILAHFNSSVTYVPFLAFTSPWDSSQLEKPSSVNVESLCVVVEIKDHPPNRVRFEGTAVKVQYKTKWHDASEQSFQQMHSLKNYLSIHGIRSPYITHLIWLRNLRAPDLPPRPHNIIAGQITWEMLLNVVGQVSPPHKSGGQWWLSAGNMDEQATRRIQEVLTKELVPTRLDRRRMEQINQRIVSKQNLHKIVGNRMLMLRGRGGTGKTVRILQLAKHLYEQEGARVLILTYNKALVADLRRLLTMMGVVDAAAHRSIRVQTVHSFFYSVLRKLGVVTEGEDDFLERYDSLKGETVEMLEVGALVDKDVKKLKASDTTDFLWDYVLIDEAQDWPDDERLILLSLYPFSKFVIADGIDQLIRSSMPANWRANYTSDQLEVVGLKNCLRMKAGLTRFVSTFASQLGLPQHEWVANEEVPGGKIFILTGEDCLSDRRFFEERFRCNRQAGNSPVDMLFCVPPNLASTGSSANAPAAVFQEWGHQVWDGTLRAVRDTYPTDTEQLRIVQYDSCRGLEGWTVFNFALDSFYEYKLNQLARLNQSSPQTLGVLMDDKNTIKLQAVRWLLIPLTRAMDTMVIHLTGRHTIVHDALQAAANLHSDFVEWLHIGG